MKQPRPTAFSPSARPCNARPQRHSSEHRSAHSVASGPPGLFARLAPFPEWFRAWRQVLRHWWVRLKFIHTRVPFWERREASQLLQADARAAGRCLERLDFEGALAALPAYRAHPISPRTLPPVAVVPLASIESSAKGGGMPR